ncbi:MAG: SDR family oxidoreductase [Deltaproteobacteria bacterium]|nr:SDR family oxidoreductase [Deltaproteobacteria bacterium]
MTEKKHILVAGGAGFIGSHLCEYFLGQGYRVTCLDNLITGREENLASFKNHPDFSFVLKDVISPIEWEGDIYAVLNLASLASPKEYYKYPIETLKVGSIGTLNLLELAKAKKARYLLTSTSEVYGDPQVHPQREDYWGNVNPIGPRSCYDESKRFSESLTIFFHRVHGVQTRIARIFNTYGSRMRLDDGRALPAFLTQALTGKEVTVFGDGSQTRSFCFVGDMVEGLAKLLFSEETTPINLGNPDEITLLQFAEMVLKMTQSKSRIVFQSLPEDDPRLRKPDITKAGRVLGWHPKVALELGLQQTIPYFLSQLEQCGTKIV